MTSAGIITQARMTSTRLPGKVLLPVGGKTLLHHHVDRLRASTIPVYVATTTNSSDDPIAGLAEELGVGVYRGSEHDVLSRYADAAQAFDLDTVIRVTSDCPLIDGGLVRKGYEQYATLGPGAYLSNTLRRTFPRGADFEVFGADLLSAANKNASAPDEREHVTPAIYRSPTVGVHQLTRERDVSRYRLTVDTDDDFRLIRLLVENFGAATLELDEIVALLERRPDLAIINAHVEQKKLDLS